MVVAMVTAQQERGDQLMGDTNLRQEYNRSAVRQMCDAPALLPPGGADCVAAMGTAAE